MRILAAFILPSAFLRQAVLLSERYITDRFLPDKAIDLIDEACSDMNLKDANTALGIPRAHNIVYLVDDQNNVAAFPDFLYKSLHTALKLAAELSARHQRGQVQ